MVPAQEPEQRVSDPRRVARAADYRWGWYGGVKLAWFERLVSAAIDYGPPALLIMTQRWEIGLMALGLILGNSGVVQGLTGWSVGKKIMGLQLGLPVRWKGDPEQTLCYPGVGRSVLRVLIHLATFFVLIFLGLQILQVLVGHYHRSWGDYFAGTIVVSRRDKLALEHKQRGQVSATGAMGKPAPMPVQA
jgi:hypothetical protein